MRIKYGITDNNIDVTDICLDKLNNNKIITIPSGDSKRAKYFTDPIIGKLKKIFILIDGKLTEYDHLCSIKIDLKDNTITFSNTQKAVGRQARRRSPCTACKGKQKPKEAETIPSLFIPQSSVAVRELAQNIDKKIQNIHSTLKLNHGNFKSELPEQKMSVRYLTGNEKVLEIGGHIGRNSLVIAYILQNNNQLVTL